MVCGAVALTGSVFLGVFFAMLVPPASTVVAGLLGSGFPGVGAGMLEIAAGTPPGASFLDYAVSRCFMLGSASPTALPGS